MFPWDQMSFSIHIFENSTNLEPALTTLLALCLELDAFAIVQTELKIWSLIFDLWGTYWMMNALESRSDKDTADELMGRDPTGSRSWKIEISLSLRNAQPRSRWKYYFLHVRYWICCCGNSWIPALIGIPYLESYSVVAEHFTWQHYLNDLRFALQRNRNGNLLLWKLQVAQVLLRKKSMQPQLLLIKINAWIYREVNVWSVSACNGTHCWKLLWLGLSESRICLFSVFSCFSNRWKKCSRSEKVYSSFWQP